MIVPVAFGLLLIVAGGVVAYWIPRQERRFAEDRYWGRLRLEVLGVDDDRTIHAELGDEKIVRYDRAGKWFIEYEPPMLRSARHIRIDHAALRAVQMEQEGGTIYLRKPGGGAFDRAVKKYRERVSLRMVDQGGSSD